MNLEHQIPGSTLSSDAGSTACGASPLMLLPNTYRAFFGGFTQLHPIQKQTLAPILAGRDVVLQSATGSGKTEAVLAPCLERLIQSGRAQALLHIVPTRALAVDLERRLLPVVGRLGLHLGIRTGDIKRAGGRRPDLMLTTPESLDVLMGSSNAELQRFVRRVRTVIIDEVHPLLHQCRGRQLACLLKRLERRAGGRVQKIALSATIADPEAVVASFGFTAEAVRLVSPVQRDIVPHLIHLKKEDEEFISLLTDLYRVWGHRKILVFANSRGQCDRLFALASQNGPFRGAAELHYSNLKPKERRRVEERFRTRALSLCIATSTLELGIDIGDVEAVILFEPPDSVSAFLQRIGRSNRRQSRTHFWGICRGEQAGSQLLRFLGLLRLARQGVVEAPLPKTFPSVLMQQVLSCLYEKKRISLPAMLDLFPEQAEALELIFLAMEKQGWLRRDSSIGRPSAPSRNIVLARPQNGLFRGGWRYRSALLERKIWSNFPETEEAYVLEISCEVVADLPRSIVRQLEPGDCVHLAGKRIRILQIIDAGERKRVMAEPAAQLHDKELFWLGGGFQVSFEVAQSMRDLLRLPPEAPEETDAGLFVRTRKLLREERLKSERAVTLANGIEALRAPNGFYCFRTFLGSIGNLVLRFTVERDLAALEDLYVASDESGITCSHWIDFNRLSLPVDRDGFRCWIVEHLRPLRTLLPLNDFAHALPDILLVQELAGFLYDSRVAERFRRLLASPAEIVSGDPACLEPGGEALQDPAPAFLQASAVGLLSGEKERWGVDGKSPAFALPAGARHIVRTLTATMIGEYMQRRQCERWLSFHFLPAGMRPSNQAGKGAGLEAKRIQSGKRHEKRALAYLLESGARLFTIEETGCRGKPRSLDDRFQETMDRLEGLVAKLHPGESCYLSQAVFLAPSLLAEHFDDALAGVCARSARPLEPGACAPDRIRAAGIPDLIRLSMSAEGPHLAVGDIKASRTPHYSQKWQVAFYALLAGASAGLRPLLSKVERAGQGLLLLWPGGETPAPLMHAFDLAPFMSAWPALLQNMGAVLSAPPAAASYRLQGHCTSCPYFETCYRQALAEEDIQFLPQLSDGTLLKLRRLGLRHIDDLWNNPGVVSGTRSK
ncbi:MAG: DEAD/DEAH box helicase [Desulfobacterales bacterium]|nr:DEAD/DEAH box helicase [Desulfobacterales bacterium]